MSSSQNSFESVNPYAAPASDGQLLEPSSDAERIRKEHIRHEASIKSIGTLYLLGAFLLVMCSMVLIVVGVATLAARSNSMNPPPLSTSIVGFGIAIFILASGLVQGATALGLFRLQPWARIVAIAFSVFGLIGIPIGTIISAYFLYLLLSRKGVYIFSDEYKEVISKTPHIRYKTSKIVWFFFGLLVILISIAFFGVMFARMSVRI